MPNMIIRSLGIILILAWVPFQAEAAVLKYELAENSEMKKGGSLRPPVEPKYRFFRITAALKEGIDSNQLTEINIKDTLSHIIENAQKKEGPDAVTAYIFETKEHIDRALPLGRAEWWPKGHSLSPDNVKNIQDKASYILEHHIDIPKKAETETVVKRLDKSQRREIFSAIVGAEDRATREAEQEYPTDATKIPLNKSRDYAFDGMFEKNMKLQKKLTEKYTKQLMKKYIITEDELKKISIEATLENWPLPES